MKHQLDFEKPVLELLRELDELDKHPEKLSMGISLGEEVQQIKKKIKETRKHIYANLAGIGPGD